MKIPFIPNEPPYGTESCYDGLRLANALVSKDPSVELTVFLTADAMSCAMAGRNTTEDYFSRERMLKRFTAGPRRSTMDALAAATLEAERVLVFRGG